ncbi:hypothetical protein HK103_007506 [Boothiomyces macroporosus]|uniref:Phospholipid/glycerol acyltransferase domain-containing protein n=1 Tax=Boothiomyces macroporosus TaxID=261099 RepID=A0AAD5UC42_9FUNG|nr:hypothetical protein HK103_007506 [Boothiomyces macroporosus]
MVLSLFFKEIRVRGDSNIPSGPVLFAVAPHANQFIDPVMLFTTCGRQVGFLAAKKSMDLFWIGLFARAFNSIPVERPQDLIKKQKGKIYMQDDELKLFGEETTFTTIKPRSVITVNGDEATVAEVISDSVLLLQKPFKPDTFAELKKSKMEFKMTPHVDQGKMFDEVVKRLSKDGAVGIFPEGGSHDRPEMLPLKAGVAIMALETLVKFPGTKLKIVPVGLHYFHADKFRSRAVIEYGEQIEIPLELVDQYKNGGHEKRQAIGLLMDTIQVHLKSLTVQAADYDSLMPLDDCTNQKKLISIPLLLCLEDLLKVFLANSAFEKEKHNPLVQQLKQEVSEYNRMLKFYGVKDHQVKNTSIKVSRAIYLVVLRLLQFIALIVLSAPMLILAWPLIFLTRKVSHERAATALAGSKVKISGRDVVSTWKLLTGLVVTPLLWFTYSFLAFLYYYITVSYSSGLTAGFTVFIALPVLSMITIRSSENAYNLLASIRPLIVSIGNTMSSSEPLRASRQKLQQKIRDLVNQLGPEVFPNFEEIRVVAPDGHVKGFSNVAANKMGRGNVDATVVTKLGQDETYALNTVFGEELDKVKLQ